MSQRDSGYERKERDLYETPEWVTLALVPHIPSDVLTVWEPACGSGKMARVLISKGYCVDQSDIETGDDFLQIRRQTDAIITNPPYALATEFIQHALGIMRPRGVVAMLLRTDFDHAKTRRKFFDDNKTFAKKLVLTKRIRWFEGSRGSPSFNHAWFIWDGRHAGYPALAYDFQRS